MKKSPPSVDAFIKVAFCLEGRDKLTKLLQYGSRALAWYILSVDPKSDIGKRLRLLFAVSQQSRKAFRLGKSAKFYQKMQSVLNDKSVSSWQRYLSVIQNTGMMGFYVYDNMVFAGKAKLLSIDSAEASKRGGILWFCANIAGFVLAANALNEDLEKEKSICDVLATEEDVERIRALKNQVQELRQKRTKKFLALLKVTCDLIVSSNTGGVRLAERLVGKKLHDGIIGSIGCISASIVLYNTWPTMRVALPQTQETHTVPAQSSAKTVPTGL